MHLENINENPTYILSLKISILKHFVILALLIIIFSLLLIYPYNDYLNYILYVNDEARLIVDDNFFPIKKKYIYINHKKYFYNVKNISEPKVINNKNYYEILIDINISNYNKKNIIKVKVLKENTTILKKFILNMKGWLNE